MDLRGYLHSNGNNCTGKSRSLFAYRTSKGVMLIKSTDALIHFDYTRYFHYYRIREVPGSPYFVYTSLIGWSKKLDRFKRFCIEMQEISD